MKVLFLTNVPSPYRVDFFNELGKACELTVLFEKNTSDERDASWKKYKFENFDGILLKGKRIGVDNAVCFGVVRYLKKGKYDHIIVSDFLDPTGMIAIEHMRVWHIPYWLECDGGFAKDGKGFKERVKKHFISGAQGYFSPCAAADEYLCTYGAKAERLHRYPFTSLSKTDIFATPASDEKKRYLRERLGMTEEKVIISVGRMIHRKGFDVLFEAAKKFSSNTGVYIIGGKPTEEYLRFMTGTKINNFHVVDFKVKEELNLYYRAADMFVLPTREDIWGLVINEAMAAGLPVITTDRCGAGLELVKNGVNGYLVPVGDSDMLADRINTILGDLKLRREMSMASLEIIHSYTIENMVSEHIKILARC